MRGFSIGTRHLLEDALAMYAGRNLPAGRRDYVVGDLAREMGLAYSGLAHVARGAVPFGDTLAMREATHLRNLLPRLAHDDLLKGARSVVGAMGFLLREEFVPKDVEAESRAFLETMLEAVSDAELTAPATSSA